MWEIRERLSLLAIPEAETAGSDYPHPDGVSLEASKYIEEQFAGFPPDAVHKITCENANKRRGLID